MWFADLNTHLLKRIKRDKKFIGYADGQRLNEVERAVVRDGFGNFANRIITHRLGVGVPLSGFGHIQKTIDIEIKSLAQFPLFRNDAVAADETEVFDKYAIQER